MTEEQTATVAVSNESIDDKPLVVAEIKKEEAKPAAEEKPAETAVAVETAPAEQPAETKPEEVKPAEVAKPAEAAPEVVKPSETAPAVVKAAEAKSVETKVTESPVKEAVAAAAPQEEAMKTEFLDETMEEVKAEPSAEGDVKPVDNTPAPENPPPSMRNVKIARIPKEVFEFMVKDEAEEGTVRINVTQLRYFVQEELWKLAKYVNGSVWEDCNFPVLDMLVPENAQKYQTVQTFNTMKIKEEEKRIVTENEKLKKLDANTYKKMTDLHKKKAWADLERKFVMKDNVISRPGAPNTLPKNDSPMPKKKPMKAPKNASQIQPAVPVEGVIKPGPGKAVSAAQNGTNNKSESARKRPQGVAAAVESPVPVKKTKPQETPKSQGHQKPQGQQKTPQGNQKTPQGHQKTPQGQNKNFPKKGNAHNNTQSRFSSGAIQKNNGGQRYNAGSRYGAQPWSNPGSMGYNTAHRFPAFNEPAPIPVPAPVGYTGSFDLALAERERSLAERERRLLAAETQMTTTAFPSSTYGSTGADYRTTYDNYTSPAFGGSTAGTTGTGYSSATYGNTYGTGSTGNYNNYGTTSSTYGSFLSTYGGAMDNNQTTGNRRRSGRR